MAVGIGEKAVVHKKGLALLLLLFIYKTLKEQPKNILGAQNRGGACQAQNEKTVQKPQKPRALALGKAKALCRRPFRPTAKPAVGSAGAKSGWGWGCWGQSALLATQARQNAGLGAPDLDAKTVARAKPGQPIRWGQNTALSTGVNRCGTGAVVLTLR